MASATLDTPSPVITLTLNLREAQLVRDLIGQARSNGSQMARDITNIYDEMVKIPQLTSVKTSFDIQVNT